VVEDGGEETGGMTETDDGEFVGSLWRVSEI
jgi:hypothetical protein